MVHLVTPGGLGAIEGIGLDCVVGLAEGRDRHARSDRELITLSSTDSRAPYVLDIHELVRQPGAQRRVELREVSPGGLELDGVVGVPDNAELNLDLRLESVMEGVLVSGTVQAPYTGVCARCLDPVGGDLVADLQELYVYPDNHETEVSDDVEVDEDN